MDYTYMASNAVSAFFEMPTSDARVLLPAHLQPLEVQHTEHPSVTAFRSPKAWWANTTRSCSR
jgi:hypothetical protein